MKRSEVILKIEERIYCEIGPIIGGEDVKYSVYNTAISILDLIEELGMLPPNNNKKRAIKKESVPCVINAMKCHVWEPED